MAGRERANLKAKRMETWPARDAAPEPETASPNDIRADEVVGVYHTMEEHMALRRPFLARGIVPIGCLNLLEKTCFWF